MHELVEEVDRSPDGPTVGAFFDFDGTLIYGFSVLALQAARLRRRDVSPQEVANALVTGIGLVLGQSDYDAVVSILGRSWRGRSIDDIDELGRKLFKQKLAGRVYPEARALVAAHQRKGHTVVLASSALSFQVEAMAADLDIEHVLCTRFEVVDGKLTGDARGTSPLGRRASGARSSSSPRTSASTSAPASPTPTAARTIELLERRRQPPPDQPDARARAQGARARLAGAPVPRAPGCHARPRGAPRRRARRVPHRHRHRHRARHPQPEQGRRGQHDDLGGGDARARHRRDPPPRARRGARVVAPTGGVPLQPPELDRPRPAHGPAPARRHRGRQEGARGQPGRAPRGRARRRGVHRPRRPRRIHRRDAAHGREGAPAREVAGRGARGHALGHRDASVRSRRVRSVWRWPAGSP